MKVIVRLFGVVPDEKAPVQHFICASKDGKTVADFQLALKSLQASLTVKGLRWEITGVGNITLFADNDQLTPDVVLPIKSIAEKVLAEI